MRMHPLRISGLAAALFAGCVQRPACPNDGDGASTDTPVAGEPYVGTGNPYESGSLNVRTICVAKCEKGFPLPLRVHTPQEPGTYAVLVFQHGFMLRNSCYDTILRHVAGHGFVVVAAQMYEPGLGPLFGRPTAAEEADTLRALLEWLPGRLGEIAGVSVRTDRLGLAGHSRGGKVVWLALSQEADLAQAVAGVDPVDGTGGPFGNQPRVIQGPFSLQMPSLVIGTGLGGSCAPEGDNHEQFYAASPSPAWHVIATEQGHADMLDAECAGPSEAICASGDDREAMVRLTGGLLVAFLRGSLQGDPSAYAWLTDTISAPTPIVAEAR